MTEALPEARTKCTRRVRVAAPAKINLYLGIHTQVDEAGYHRADSVMAALELADTITVTPANALSVACKPAIGGPPEKNSAWRAAVALGRELGRDPLVHIGIEKRIPVQAGLGGPSADAAAVLVALCELWGVESNDPRAVAAAMGVGADVPFFLGASPAYLSGRGDVLEETFDLGGPLPIALVKPLAAGVSTPAAYRAFDAAPQALPPLEPLLAALRAGRTAEVPAAVANNLAPAACALEPRIAEVLCWLRAQPDVLAADVCGSGACSFAICTDADAAARVARAASRDARWWSCATATRGTGASALAEPAGA